MSRDDIEFIFIFTIFGSLGLYLLSWALQVFFTWWIKISRSDNVGKKSYTSVEKPVKQEQKNEQRVKPSLPEDIDFEDFQLPEESSFEDLFSV